MQTYLNTFALTQIFICDQNKNTLFLYLCVLQRGKK